MNEQTIKLCEGCYLVKTEIGGVLFGAPPEVVKKILQTPDSPRVRIVVAPSVPYVGGNSQFSFEFILYYHLFNSGGFSRGEKLIIVGTKKQCQQIETILRITLLGPTDEEMKRWGTSKGVAEMLRREMDHFALKRDGKILQIRDLVDFHYFNELGEVVIQEGARGVKIAKLDKNIFLVNDLDVINLNFEGEQIPPFPLPVFYKAVEPSSLGLEVLSASNGFDPENACSGLIAGARGLFYLIDSMPYVAEVVERMGLSLLQIEAVCPTHVHDDHWAASSIHRKDKKLKVITTPEIFGSLCLKISAIWDIDENEVRGYFDFVLLTPTKPVKIPGGCITAHYNAHSIPTIGFTFSIVDSNGEKKSLLIGGDNLSWTGIEELHQKGVISDNRRDRLLEILNATKREDIVMAVYDAGGAPLHGKPVDFASYIESNPEVREKIFLTHSNSSKLPPEIKNHLLRPTQHFNLVPGNSDLFDVISIQDALNQLGVDRSWLSAFLQSGTIQNKPTGTVVIEEGSKADNVYVVLSGIFEVLVGSNSSQKKIALLQAGDIFGEMAFVQRKPRNATVRAVSPVKIFSIPGEIFTEFISHNPETISALQTMWKTRDFLRRVKIFAEVSAQLLAKISSFAEKMVFPEGMIIINEGTTSKDCYVIFEGEVSVEKGGEQIAVLGPRDIVGEIVALELQKERTATIKAISRVTVYKINATQFNQLYLTVPSVRRHLRFILTQRGYSPEA
ncbi:MAG: cyclic nucleotide-binding domain-containing protein [Patescibacteria group bacterium]|nr:cyclic nucleotide-binding domain-containing protein [Patescibacteria group bacterium]MDD5490484.1 cyclic nucleotide-binding domain-containing protein [Patescibacteria group bacterium]